MRSSLGSRSANWRTTEPGRVKQTHRRRSRCEPDFGGRGRLGCGCGEGLRAGGQIGSGLNAELHLFAEGELGAALRATDSELRFWFQTSEAQIEPLSAAPAEAQRFELEGVGTLAVFAHATTHAKCERCWHYRDDVGSNPAHPTLCGRCDSNLHGSGEARQVA